MVAWLHQHQLAKVIDLEGQFDKQARCQFDVLIQEVLQGYYSQVVLNFGALVYIDSSGLGKITLAYLELKSRGIDVAITGLRPKIHRLLDRHGLSRLLFASDSRPDHLPIS